MDYKNITSIWRLFEIFNPEQFNAICQANGVGSPERIKMVFIQLGYVHSCEESNYKKFFFFLDFFFFAVFFLQGSGINHING